MEIQFEKRIQRLEQQVSARRDSHVSHDSYTKQDQRSLRRINNMLRSNSDDVYTDVYLGGRMTRAKAQHDQVRQGILKCQTDPPRKEAKNGGGGGGGGVTGSTKREEKEKGLLVYLDQSERTTGNHGSCKSSALTEPQTRTCSSKYEFWVQDQREPARAEQNFIQISSKRREFYKGCITNK